MWYPFKASVERRRRIGLIRFVADQQDLHSAAANLPESVIGGGYDGFGLGAERSAAIREAFGYARSRPPGDRFWADLGMKEGKVLEAEEYFEGGNVYRDTAAGAVRIRLGRGMRYRRPEILRLQITVSAEATAD